MGALRATRRDNGNLVIRADIPGLKPEEVKIEVENAAPAGRSSPRTRTL